MSAETTPAQSREERPRAMVRSFARRGSRLKAGQQAAWDAHRERWVLPDDVAGRRFEAQRWFGRSAPLVVEVGSGNGESLVTMAAARPEVDVLALEVWRPGVAGTLRRLHLEGVQNVRLLMADAQEALPVMFGPGELAELWTFFPDPWHKLRHHKRRLVGPEFSGVVADLLEPGGHWRLATDWADYAEHVTSVLASQDRLVGGQVERWEARPVTKFERRGLSEGRVIHDFDYRRRT